MLSPGGRRNALCVPNGMRRCLVVPCVRNIRLVCLVSAGNRVHLKKRRLELMKDV